MKKLLVAALMLICASAADEQTPQRQSHRSGLELWTPVGPWAVLLLPLQNGSYVCTATTRTPPWGPAGYSMAFVLSLSATHFYLYYDNSLVPTPAELMLAVDNKPIARLPVMEQELEPSGKHLIVADLPDDMLLRQVVPSMRNGKMLSIAAGQHRYPMPISGFRIVILELVDCGRRVGAIVGRQSR